MSKNTTTPYAEFAYRPVDVGEDVSADIHPVGAGSVVPPWYKMLEAFSNPDDITTSTVKMCRPFSDSFKAGFIIHAPTDIHIEKTEFGKINVETGSVTEHGETPYESTKNSRYPVPEVMIDIPWRINTPPGYSSLITKPLNREVMTPGIKQHALFVPTDSYNGAIPIPAAMTEDVVTIDKGDPLAQVIPLRRNRIPRSIETYNESDRPCETARYHTKQYRSSAMPDMYRSVHWVKKPVTTVVSEEEATDRVSHDITSLDFTGDPEESPLRFITADLNYGVIPEPKPSSEYAPPWIDDISTLLSGSERITALIEQVEGWMRDACSLGVISPFHCTVEMVQDEMGDASWRTPFDNAPVKVFGRSTIGEEFPLPFALPNMLSEWISEAPAGYSNLYVEPFSHHQQYYRSFSGIVDDDRYRDKINAPGHLVTDEEKLHFEPGEAVCQIVPIHRDSIIETAVLRDAD